MDTNALVVVLQSNVNYKSFNLNTFYRNTFQTDLRKAVCLKGVFFVVVKGNSSDCFWGKTRLHKKQKQGGKDLCEVQRSQMRDS